MADNKDYYAYTHHRSEVKTIASFCDQDGISIANHYIGKEEELLSYKGDTGVSNRERVIAKYTPEQRRRNEGKPAKTLELNVNTKLLIPKSVLNREVMVTEGNQVIATDDYQMFLSDKLAELIKDSKQWPIHYNTDKTTGGLKKAHVNVSVWMWCRALSSDNDDELRGSYINVTPFIQTLTTNVAQRGGNFSLSLAPLICEPSLERGWVIKKADIANYYDDGDKSYLAKTHLFTARVNELKRNQFFFHNVIQANDMVFIRFEQLLSEDDRKHAQKPFALSERDLPGKNFDMIGLVDGNTMAIAAESNELSININGRDLTKAVLDDGCYFYPLEFATNLFVNNQNDSNFKRRMFGRLEELAVYLQRPLDFSVRYILGRLGQLGVVRNDMFKYYPADQLSTYLDEETNKETLMKGIWQITKILIDERIAPRRICDSSISTESGSIINYLEKICQAPFVEMYTDTYGDQFYYIFRQPPFTQDAIVSAINGSHTSETEAVVRPGTLIVEVDQLDVQSEDLDWNTQDIYSWYKINPQALYFGQGSEISLSYLPAIYFDEYAEIWGSKPLDVTSNYVPYVPTEGDKQAQALSYLERQAFRDLKFMIDTHAYLPFTRRGSFTANGDRRIKKGMWIRYKATGELFYVDSVSQSATMTEGTVDRTMTVQVSRGMVEKYIFGENVGGELVSYFNIIQTPFEERFFQSSKTAPLSVDILKDWRVNKKVFNFFMKRNQFKTT